jgi:drug/metabolite transporter (DMT)-like permease
MQAFAAERRLFVKERANRYYSPVTYYSAKILFDLLPLRIIPPLILGLIMYPMIGLREDSPIYLVKFLLVLVLFNLTSASVCLAISIVFVDASVASLMATLVMLFEMLFGGLLLNKTSLPTSMSWLTELSFFNAAFEAMIVNEVPPHPLDNY